MNKRPHEGSAIAELGHACKKRDVTNSIVEKIDEELAYMRTSKDANVQVRGCVNLWQMAADPDTRKALASTSAIQLILSTINSNSNHIGIVTVALNTLWCILSSDQNSNVISANSKLMASFGGIKSILDIARKHINNEFVCKRGCELLTIFANEPDNDDVKKGICCVLEMMHAHVAHGDVQFAAFGILSLFPPTEYTKEEITEIITSVLESLQECREDVAVQCKGLVLLRKLTKNQNGSPLLLQKGGVSVIMRALRKHQTNDIICERGFQILLHLSSAERQFARDITVNGGLSVIVGALKCHTNNDGIQLYGIKLIHTLLGWDIHTYMKGGVDCVLAAMRSSIYHVELQEHACGILSILAEQDDYRTLIMIDGGVDLLVVAMKTHLVNVNINISVCKTLSQLHMILEVCRERQVVEMIDCVLLAMRVHQQTLIIQRHACALLELLAENPRYKHEIIVRGGRACVKTAIFSVGLNGRNLLQKLSRKSSNLQLPANLQLPSNLQTPANLQTPSNFQTPPSLHIPPNNTTFQPQSPPSFNDSYFNTINSNFNIQNNIRYYDPTISDTFNLQNPSDLQSTINSNIEPSPNLPYYTSTFQTLTNLPSQPHYNTTNNNLSPANFQNQAYFSLNTNNNYTTLSININNNNTSNNTNNTNNINNFFSFSLS